MKITAENEKYYLEALRTPFLTEKWERAMFTQALMDAEAWGKKIEKKEKEYRHENRLLNRY